jgi:cell wall-associated NlpC family hydrolase
MNVDNIVSRLLGMLDKPTIYVAGAGGRTGRAASAEDAAEHIANPRQRLADMAPDEREAYVQMAAQAGLSLSHPVRGCDCSGLVCWAFGLDRVRSAPDGHHINTDWIWADAHGAQRLFRRVDDDARPLRCRLGAVLVYPKTPASGERYGHVGIVSAVGDDGMPLQVVHCSADNFSKSFEELGDALRANAIAQTGPEQFFAHLDYPRQRTIAAVCTRLSD